MTIDDSWYFRERETNPKMDKAETVEEKAKRLGVPILPQKLPKMFSEPEDVLAICGHCGKEITLSQTAPCYGVNVCPLNR